MKTEKSDILDVLKVLLKECGHYLDFIPEDKEGH